MDLLLSHIWHCVEEFYEYCKIVIVVWEGGRNVLVREFCGKLSLAIIPPTASCYKDRVEHQPQMPVLSTKKLHKSGLISE